MGVIGSRGASQVSQKEAAVACHVKQPIVFHINLQHVIAFLRLLQLVKEIMITQASLEKTFEIV